MTAIGEHCNPSWGLGKAGYSWDPRSEGAEDSRRGRNEGDGMNWGREIDQDASAAGGLGNLGPKFKASPRGYQCQSTPKRQ